MITVMLVSFIGLLVLGFPIFMSLGVSMVLPGLLKESFVADGAYLFRTTFASVDNTALLAVPLFILSGDIMSKGKISEKILNLFAVIIGKRTGGIPMAVILTSTIYGAICGAGAAAAAAVGAMAIPMLIDLGYKREFAAAVVGAGGGIGIIIPPSIPFVTYAMMTDTSVGALFTAGFIPGIFIGLCLMIYIYFYCKNKGEDKEKIAANYEKLKSIGVWNIFRNGIWALLSPIIILGGIYTGITTPTEAAVISVVYSMLVCVFIYKTIKPNEIYGILVSSVRGYAGIGLLIAFALGLGRVFTLLQIPQTLAEYMLATFNSSGSVLAIIIIVMLIIGMFMDVVPAVMIFAPLLLPVVKSFGIDPVHFGIILTVTVSVGLISPPYGLNLFVTSTIAETSVQSIYKPAINQCIVYIIAIVFITAFPQMSLFLGSLAK